MAKDDHDDIRFVLVYQHAKLDFYSVSSLKQKSTDRHVAPFGHIILISSCVLSREATFTSYIVVFLVLPANGLPHSR